MVGTLHDDVCTFVVSSTFLLRMRNISDKVVEKMEHAFYIQ